MNVYGSEVGYTGEKTNYFGKYMCTNRLNFQAPKELLEDISDYTEIGILLRMLGASISLIYTHLQLRICDIKSDRMA